jgi:Zn-finger domain-containing protein
MRVVNTRKSDIYYIEVLGKTLDILDVFGRSEQQHLSLHQISVETRLNKNTVFRILYTLAEHGYISKEHQTYQLGAKLVDLGNVKLRRKDLVSVASPYLDALRDQFGETVNWAFWTAEASDMSMCAKAGSAFGLPSESGVATVCIPPRLVRRISPFCLPTRFAAC